MRRRSGMSLVEMLVAMALTVFIMLILAEAFAVGLDVFTKMKAVGDLEARLRTAFVTLRRDLEADHFEGKKRLSDRDFWNGGPPREGFFRLWQGDIGTLEGNSGPITSQRAVNHALHFTVKLRGNDRPDFFTARVPAGSPLLTAGTTFFDLPTDARMQATDYSCQWAEVAYFLRSNGTTANGTPLFALYRRQLLLVPNNEAVNWDPARQVSASELPNYLEVSCKPNLQTGQATLYFASPSDVTIPQLRFGMDPAPAAPPNPGGNGGWPSPGADPVSGPTYPTLAEQNPALAGADVLLTDVVSFHVAVLVPRPGKWFTAIDDALGSGQNPRFSGAGTPVRVFDTWTATNNGYYDYSTWNTPGTHTSIPGLTDTQTGLPIRVLALAISLRVWDLKTQQTRQVTLVQDM